MKTIMLCKDHWKALNACRSNDETRLAFSCIFVLPSYICASDGKILITFSKDIIGNAEGLEPGAYEIIGNGKPDKAGFVLITIKKTDYETPNFDAVIPAMSEEEDQKNIYLSGKAKEKTHVLSSALARIHKYNGQALNYEYLDRLYCLNETWTLHKTSETAPAFLTIARGDLLIQAVILPINIKY